MVGSLLPAAGRDWHYNCSAKRMIDLNYAPAPPMDPSEIYAKTELGLAELRDRKLNLPITLRGLLILIDGTRTRRTDCQAFFGTFGRAERRDHRAGPAFGGRSRALHAGPANDERRDQRPSRIQGLRPDDAVAEDSERPRPARSVAGFRQILGQAPRPRAGDADRLV